ncbi:hypothetical protein N7470_004718 [Penicillium chermesinum]|nr:hypothetical protein N7470_004718 [Penicillium chermesinum]
MDRLRKWRSRRKSTVIVAQKGHNSLEDPPPRYETDLSPPAADPSASHYGIKVLHADPSARIEGLKAQLIDPSSLSCTASAGWFAKKAILLSQNAAEPKSRSIFDCLKGVVFMGTPHRGAWMADWAKTPASALGLVKSTNVMLLDILQRDNQLLDSIQVDFLTMIRRLRESGRRVEISCFYEELPFPVVGKIVNEQSATLDGFDAVSIYANHRDMVRFASDEDPGFRRVLWQLHDWTSQISTVQAKQETEVFVLDAEDRACLGDLQTTNPRYDKRRIETTRGRLYKDSYCWVLNDEKFNQWRDPGKGGELLWIKGAPGRGKTMLLCGIIDEISDAGQYLLQISWRGLIYMLIDQNPALISHVRGRYDELGKQLFEGINSWHALSNIFVDILDELDHVHSTVYLIIDALDECTNGLFELLELITENVSRFPHVKWLLSSRIWPEITERLHLVPDKSRITLELDETSVAGAVKTFIDIKVSELAKLKNYTQQVFDAVYSCLISHAQGTFLWVALVCERLARVSRMRTIEMLTAFPPGLDALYNRMMQQVLEHDEAPLCRQILEVASLVYRPLTLHELPTFIDLPTHVNENDHGLLEEIIEYCGSFLTISESTILFVHNSAKDYLLEHAQSDVLPTGKDQGHIAIFLRSLEVMEVTLKRDLYNTGFAGLSIRPMDVPRPTSDPLVKARYAFEMFYCNQIPLLVGGFELPGKHFHGFERDNVLDQICQRSPDENLASQLADASRFIQYHQPAIESSPLQAYCSSLLFSPTGSEVQRNFLGEMADWVTINPSIQTWNPCVQTLEGHSSPVMSLEWSPDLTMIASFSYDSICIWNPQTRQCILRLEGHTSDIKATAWSPDGKLLASSSVDCTLRVWDMETGQCTLILENHKDPISAIYWSSDGNRLVSVSGIRHVYEPVPMVIKTWSRETGHCELTLEDEKPDAHVFPSYPRVFPSSDGKFLISTTPEGGMRTWQPLGHKMTLASTKHKMSRSPWIWTDDRKHVMYSVPSTGHVKVLDASTLPYSTIFELEHPDVRVIALSLDELSLASASGRKSLTRIKIWSLITGQCISSFDEKSVVIDAMMWMPDGRLVASSANIIQIWNPSTGHCMSTLTGHSGEVTSLALLGASQIVSSGEDHTLKIWDASSSTMNQDHDSGISNVMWSPSGAMIASFGPDSNIGIWDSSTGGPAVNNEAT